MANGKMSIKNFKWKDIEWEDFMGQNQYITNSFIISFILPFNAEFTSTSPTEEPKT
jgi:hypothetical protein